MAGECLTCIVWVSVLDDDLFCVLADDSSTALLLLVHVGQAYAPLFFLWGHTMIALAMVLAPWFSSPETALIAGWFAVILISLMGGPYLGTLFTYVGWWWVRPRSGSTCGRRRSFS